MTSVCLVDDSGRTQKIQLTDSMLCWTQSVDFYYINKFMVIDIDNSIQIFSLYCIIEYYRTMASTESETEGLIK